MSRERSERLPGNRKIPSAIEKETLRLLVEEDWSPMQISGYLNRKGYKISHETLYRRIRADLSGELASHCRHKMKYRRHISRLCPTKAMNIPNRTSIRERPLEATGTRFGDWEMDLIVGKGAILTLTERSIIPTTQGVENKALYWSQKRFVMDKSNLWYPLYGPRLREFVKPYGLYL